MLRSSTLEFEKEIFIIEMHVKAVDESSITMEMLFYYRDSPEVLQFKKDVIIKTLL